MESQYEEKMADNLRNISNVLDFFKRGFGGMRGMKRKEKEPVFIDKEINQRMN